VVNCTHGVSKIRDYHAGTLQYYEFPISNWHNILTTNDPSQIQCKCLAPSLPHTSIHPYSNLINLVFVDPLFSFIDSALSRGASVLVHCLAGAHRAGTTGCLCLMRYADMDPATAIRAAKSLRPVIDPIGHLPEFLNRYQIAKLINSRK
jgi:Dual specificity phosphatase, catalytic domain